MSDARDVQQVLARLKDAVHSNRRHIAGDARDKDIALDVREGPPSGYTPLFPSARSWTMARTAIGESATSYSSFAISFRASRERISATIRRRIAQES